MCSRHLLLLCRGRLSLLLLEIAQIDLADLDCCRAARHACQPLRSVQWSPAGAELEPESARLQLFA